jgi:phosphoinositide-3-kinase regulatory subunit 4
MVIQMIDLNPTLRPNFETLLNSARGSAFPESFYSFYHGYVHSVEELPSPSPFSATAHFTNIASNGAGRVSQISMVPSSAGGLLSAGGTGANTPTTATPSVFSAASHTTTFSHTTSGTGVTATTTTAVQDAKGRTAEEQRRVPNDADRRIDTIWNDFERVVQYLNEEINDTTNAPTVAPTTSGLGQPTTVLHVSLSIRFSQGNHMLTEASICQKDVLPVQIDIPNISSTLPGVRDRNMKAAERGMLDLA